MAKLNDHDHQFKLVIIGDTGVGKSSILLRFADNSFTETYISTIGVDFRFRTAKLDQQTVKLQIWDTAGQERFRTITSAYYRGADAIIVVYDVCNELSFEHVQDWITEVQRFTSDDTCRLLVGNKSDRADRTVSTDRAQRYAQSQGMQFLETSAKEASNVDMAFLMVTAELVKSRLGSKSKSLVLSNVSQEIKTKYCC